MSACLRILPLGVTHVASLISLIWLITREDGEFDKIAARRGVFKGKRALLLGLQLPVDKRDAK
jgi:hypothetical protein